MESVNPSDKSHSIPHSSRGNSPSRADNGGSNTVGNPWNISQIFILILCAAGIVWLFRRFGLEGMLSIAMVALGLGFVIFIHELGHFAVAKWCDVFVETFSIGFGPAIPGCSFRRGETFYKIAWFPLGGYVKMLGEGTESEEDDDNPRSFKNKSVWQRMAIISAGVVMNVILGFVCFIFVYRTHGVERQPAIIDMVEAGSPAWIKGARTGSVIDQIGDVRNPHWEDLKYVVMLSDSDEVIPFAAHLPGKPEESFDIKPRLSKTDLYPVIGLLPAVGLNLMSKPRENFKQPAWHGSAAAAAEPPLQFGDSIVATTDPDNPAQVTPLPVDPRNPSGKALDYFEFRRRLRLLAGQPIKLKVRRASPQQTASPQEIEVNVPAAFHVTLGLRMRIGQVTAVREQSPADREASRIQPRDSARGIDGDILKQVEVQEADGRLTRYVTSPSKEQSGGVKEKPLDPVRLPDDLKRWAASISDPARRVVHIRVLRQQGHEGRKTYPPEDKEALRVPWDDGWRENREVPLGTGAPQSIPELGLAYQVETIVDGVDENSPAAAQGIKRDDIIKEIRFRELDSNQTLEPGKWLKLETEQWAHYFRQIQEAESPEVTLRIERARQQLEIEVKGVNDTTWPREDRGFLFRPEPRLQKADSIGQAVQMGLKATHQSIMTICLNLKAMITRRISIKTVGGPIMIATLAYEVASDNFYRFILFMGMISINLAVINFLPIPILDGGHMVFLIYEKLRGIPASEAVRTYASIAGLVVIVSLMLFVFWQDIMRLF